MPHPLYSIFKFLNFPLALTRQCRCCAALLRTVSSPPPTPAYTHRLFTSQFLYVSYFYGGISVSLMQGDCSSYSYLFYIQATFYTMDQVCNYPTIPISSKSIFTSILGQYSSTCPMYMPMHWHIHGLRDKRLLS